VALYKINIITIININAALSVLRRNIKSCPQVLRERAYDMSLSSSPLLTAAAQYGTHTYKQI